jgi:hypothetical protein
MEGLVEHPVTADSAIEPFLKENIPGLWTYYCVSQTYKVPNRFMALRSPRCRAIGILMYYYNIKGFLHWGYNFYYSALSKTMINPFQDTGGLRDWPAGDPFLVYPGADGRPLSSIRGEVQREAMEDIRILSLAEGVLGRDSVLAIIHEDWPGELTFTDYPQNAEYYFNLREKIAEALAKKN